MFQEQLNMQQLPLESFAFGSQPLGLQLVTDVAQWKSFLLDHPKSITLPVEGTSGILDKLLYLKYFRTDLLYQKLTQIMDEEGWCPTSIIPKTNLAFELL
eukprot:CAMPEP_0201283422 /NCGR_PEP_ID=MMETSP1317-20130820/8513_1 /ASSEMBLY_ACC=CAM_ASM_000770 /TAXON_ID=187299 /ORGANISM="Undescribed Undescribed, Strain Undescribed" /LENGTH=99 /DNA_ID=CAMNT_0047599617 /DNA_START=248 /DNA_END=544 /DNA_ORIENTATION=+